MELLMFAGKCLANFLKTGASNNYKGSDQENVVVGLYPKQAI